MRTRLVSPTSVGKHAFLLCQKRVQCSACWHAPVRPRVVSIVVFHHYWLINGCTFQRQGRTELECGEKVGVPVPAVAQVNGCEQKNNWLGKKSCFCWNKSLNAFTLLGTGLSHEGVHIWRNKYELHICGVKMIHSFMINVGKVLGLVFPFFCMLPKICHDRVLERVAR